VSNSLVLIGKDYSTLNHLKRQKAKLDKKYGFHEVFFIENMDRNDIPGILDGAVLYICSSRWEGYSVSLIEAMARKVPFVSTDVGNARSLPGGLIADDTELHKVISEVINNKELRSKLSMAGYEYAVNNCQVNNKVKELIGIIESIN
jgi:glycosyltransferase involved in cell wall biosynthesis